MSEEQLKAFLEAIKADEALQGEVNEAEDDAHAVMAIAKAAGFVISAEELARAQAEISEDDLAEVSGGYSRIPAQNVVGSNGGSGSFGGPMSVAAIGVFLEACLVWWSKWT